MNVLDQVIVGLWFLPVVLFIVIPLCITCLWGVVSLLLGSFGRVAGQERSSDMVVEASVAGS